MKIVAGYESSKYCIGMPMGLSLLVLFLFVIFNLNLFWQGILIKKIFYEISVSNSIDSNLKVSFENGEKEVFYNKIKLIKKSMHSFRKKTIFNKCKMLVGLQYISLGILFVLVAIGIIGNLTAT